MNFLGVDGGGSSTDFIIINEKGTILGRSRKPTCHYAQTSLENFEKTMIEGIFQVCDEAKIAIAELDFSFLGIPGYGEAHKDMVIINSIIGNILTSGLYKIGNDAEVGWAGSLACKPGINIVAGTGTIGFGIDNIGKSARVGGWGPFCGDEGSAYWISKKALEIFTKQADGRIEKTILYHKMKSSLNITQDFDLIDIVINKMGKKREEIASISKIIYNAAEDNDKYAIEVFENAAYEHSLIIKSLISKLDFSNDNEILVSYSGGVFNSGEYVLKPLDMYLKDYNTKIKLIPPILKPITGAGLYALQSYLGQVSKDVINNLKIEESNWMI